MSISIVEIATLITAIAGLATAVVALWNVRELRLMRTVTSSPLLTTKDQPFTIVCGEDGAISAYPGQIPTVHLINFGNGPAINACATWSVPDDELIQLIRSYDPHNYYKVGFEKSPYAEEPCLKLYRNHFVMRQLNERLNPLVPSSSGESTQVKLPSYYFEAFRLYITLAVHGRSDKKTYFPIRPFPCALLSLTYRDLANDETTVNYRISPSYNHNATHLLSTNDAYACSLIVSEVSK